MTTTTIREVARRAALDLDATTAWLRALAAAELRALEREARQRWRTPGWLLDDLIGSGWAGPWHVDLYADADGHDAITMREGGRWGVVLPGVRPWLSAGDDVLLTREVGRAFANPPFALWSDAVGTCAHLVRICHVRELTLVGPLDLSTEAGRVLERMRGEVMPGAVHAVRVPYAGRWAFEPPPELRAIVAALGTSGGWESPSRTSGVWVLRRVPPTGLGRSGDRPRTVPTQAPDVDARS